MGGGARSRISSVLAAFAAAGGLPPGAFERAASGPGTPAGLGAAAATATPGAAAASTSSAVEPSTSSAAPGPSTETPKDSRRRSLRLSAKGAPPPSSSTPAPTQKTAESLLADALMADADDMHDGFDDDLDDEVIYFFILDAFRSRTYDCGF